jgi:diguanylate cyclase (GGDEF)-like protein
MTDRTRALGGALAFVLTGALSLEAATRPMAFERLSLEQGLSQSTVLTIFQDSRGFIWLGTEDGLDRYDGLSFTSYKYDAKDPASLPNNMVWAIAEDAQGDLWVGTEGGGVARWDHERDHFVRLGSGKEASLRIPPRVRALLVASDGKVWIGTKDEGLARLDPKSGRLEAFRHDPDHAGSLTSDGVYAILPDRAGKLWIGTDGGLDRLDPATGAITPQPINAAVVPGAPGAKVRALREDRNGVLWIGTLGEGLARLDPSDGRITAYRHDPAVPASLSHDRVRALLEDKAGRLWVATDGGLDLLEGAGFRHYRNDPTDPRSLSDSNVMSLYEDQSGLLWVGTRSGGVHKWNPATWAFGHRTQVAGDPSSLADRMVTSFAEDRLGRIFVGTLGAGLHLMDRLTGDVSRYQPREGKAGVADRVMALATDAASALWIGTMDQGLYRLDPATGSLKGYRHDPKDPRSLSDDAIMSLAVDGGGDVWIGTHGAGLNRYDSATGSFRVYRHDPGQPTSLSSDVVTCMATDPSGTLWVGTDGGGLNAFDRRSGQFRHFAHDPGDANSLGSNAVFSLHVDGKGRVWVGMRGAGLARLDRQDAAHPTFRHFTQREGLVNDVVYGIVPDGDGRLWLSTNNGLARFDPSLERFTSYDSSHGLQSSEFNFGAHYRAGNGELFFGGINGFNAFDPQRLVQNARLPPVVLTSLQKQNRAADVARPLWRLDEASLGYRDDVVTFEFAALDFVAPQRNRYAYKLEGFDRDFVDVGNLHRATYTNLPPGAYHFRVKAANSDGVWNEAGLDLPVRVEAPPWRRWWAYVGYVLAVGGGLFGFVRVQERKLEREVEYARRLETEVDQRTQELAARNVDLEVANKGLAEASLTDALTGLRNRRFLFEHVSKDVDLVRRRYLAAKNGSATPTFDVSFVMIDLDHFKVINDTFGHPGGDVVLRGVRQALERCCRHSDVLIRWGGDEFLLVGRDNDPEQVGILAERIRKEIEAATFEITEGRVARTTCSIGYSCYPFVHGDPELYDWEEILALADAALYAAKRERNAWVGYLGPEDPSRLEHLRSIRIDPTLFLAENALRVMASSRALEQPRPDAAPEEGWEIGRVSA